VFDHHLAAFAAGDLEAILEDDTDASVLMLPDATIRGRDGLRAVYGDLLSGLFAPGTFELTLDATTVEGDVAYIVWHAGCASAEIPFASDTYVVRDGKIATLDRRPEGRAEVASAPPLTGLASWAPRDVGSSEGRRAFRDGRWPLRGTPGGNRLTEPPHRMPASAASPHAAARTTGDVGPRRR
jgi:SnoaL-like protein